jgi:thiamine kinase-like enzyme
MAKRRRPTATFEVDVLASNQAVGPGIKSCTETGILMDYLVDGTTLDEETIHAPNQEPLLKGIALQLKGFHSLVAEPSGPNMLWYSLDAMLHDSTCAQLQKEFQYLISQISPLPLSTCLGHGDFKPSNVMLLPSPAGEATSIPDDIRFIDFELSGLGYRGFDVAKFFRRTDRKQSNKANLDYFVQAYCSNDFNEAKMLTMEAELLLPLTVRTFKSI